MDADKAIPTELQRLLMEFEQGERFSRFRDTAVYYSLLFNCELEQKRLKERQAAMDREPVFT